MAGELTWSGYKAAAAEALDGANLDSLADGCLAAAGEALDTITEIDNTSTKYLYADFELSLASLDITARSVCNLFIISTVDGTDYPDYTVDHSTPANVVLAEANFFVKAIEFHAANAAQRQTARGVVLPPGKFRVAIMNKLGVAFASSSNTLKWRPYNEAYS